MPWLCKRPRISELIPKPSKPGAHKRMSDEALLTHIRAIHAEVKGEYGWPKMWKELVARGHRVGKERVRRLMQQHGIRARCKRKFVVTTDSKHHLPIAPDLVQRNFTMSAPNQVWTGDITYPSAEPYAFTDTEALSFISASPAEKSAELTMALASNDAERVAKMVASMVIFLNERAKGYTFTLQGDNCPAPATAPMSPPAWMAAPPGWWDSARMMAAPAAEPLLVKVVGMPDRVTQTAVTYDDEGNITSSSQTETDAA